MRCWTAWDAAASGYDEAGNRSTGLYRFIDGGKRYPPGKFPQAEPKAFDPNGAVANVDDVPASEKRQYPHKDYF